jgi:hypothetical protein
MAQTTTSEQPTATNNLTINDYLLVSVDNGDDTFTSKKIAKNRILGYRVYSALLTQTNDSAPTAIVLQNELNNTISLARDEKGSYSLTTPTNTFTTNKTFVLIGTANATTAPSIDTKILVSLENQTQIRITTVSASSTEDGCLNNTAIEIRVYN